MAHLEERDGVVRILDNTDIPRITLGGGSAGYVLAYNATKGVYEPTVPGAGSQTLAATLALGNDAGAVKITNLGAPSIPSDAATKSYVDGVFGGISPPNISVVLATGNDAGGRKIANVGTPTNATDVATKGYVDGITTPSLATVLGIGNAAGGLKITGLGTPTVASDAVTKAYADGLVPAAPSLAAVLAVGNSAGAKITNLTTPTAAADAATKAYVDGFLAGQNALFIDWIAEYSVNATGVGGEATNLAAWNTLITDLNNHTTRSGIRDIVLMKPNCLVNGSSTFAATDLHGVRFHFFSGVTFNESASTTADAGYFVWTGAADTYFFTFLNGGTNQRPIQTIGSWNFVTTNDNRGWCIWIDNANNWSIDTLCFGSNGGSLRLQRGITTSSTSDNAHAVVNRIFAADVYDGAVVNEGGGFTLRGGNISHSDAMVGAVSTGKAQRTVTDAVRVNASPTITSATAAFDLNMEFGRPVSGTGIPTGAYIKTVNSATSITISANALSGGSGGTLVIGSAVPGSEAKFESAVKFDGGAGGAGGAVGIVNMGSGLYVNGCDFEGYNSFSRTAAVNTTNTSPTITSAALFAAADAELRFRPGAEISGAGIPTGARVKTFNSTSSITLDQNCTATAAITATIVRRAVGVDNRRIENNNFSLRRWIVHGTFFTGHDGTMLPVRCSFAPGSLGSAQGGNYGQNMLSNCLDTTGGASDTKFFQGGKTVVDFCDTWHDYNLLLRGALAVVS